MFNIIGQRNPIEILTKNRYEISILLHLILSNSIEMKGTLRYIPLSLAVFWNSSLSLFNIS